MKNNKTYSIGVDIGGTNMKSVLFDLEAREVMADYSLATPRDSLDHFLIMLNALIEPLKEKARKDRVKVKGIGIGLPGLVDFKNKKIIDTPNVPILEGINFAREFKPEGDLLVKLDNDTNCFLRAEVKIWAGQKYDNVYGIILGTGIGGAWWINKEIYQGSHGAAGEPGRMIVNFAEPIELEAAYHKLTQANPASLAEEAYRGDELAQKSYKEIGQYLGLAFANIINLVDPQAIIIGGGLVASSGLFLSEIKNNMKKYIMSPEAKKIKVLRSKLGEQAGAIGAALLIE